MTLKAKNVIVLGQGSMFKKIAIITSWFFVAPTAFVLLSLLLFQHKKIDNLQKTNPTITAIELTNDNQIEGTVLGQKIEDFRPIYVSNFLKNTPLEPYSNYIVEVSDRYQIDYRLIPAIAMKESGAGRAIDESTHNAWGFENGKTAWPSWESALDDVAKTFKNRYADRGLKTPDEIMPLYAPPQLLTGATWAKEVNKYFEELSTL